MEVVITIVVVGILSTVRARRYRGHDSYEQQERLRRIRRRRKTCQLHVLAPTQRQVPQPVVRHDNRQAPECTNWRTASRSMEASHGTRRPRLEVDHDRRGPS